MSGLQVSIRVKRYPGGPPVIRDLRLTVPEGEKIALLGPSGAGKTTLLNLLAGLDRDYDGEILRHGSPLLRSRPRLGMVFQEPRLLPWMSVRDNIALVLPERRTDPRRVDELLEAVGLADRGNALPGSLSGGMQRRVALARAFAVKPELLLLDEPFVSLDTPTARQLRGYLQSLWQSLRPTVVLVSHDPEDAIALADRMLFLSTQPARILLEQALPAPDSSASRRLRRQTAQQLLESRPELLAGRLPVPTEEADPRTAHGRRA